MDLREWRRELRIAAGEGDQPSMVDLLNADVPFECLHEAGTAALSTLPGPGHREVLQRLGASLGQRGWVGDCALADELEAPERAVLTATPIDLEELGEALEDAGADSGVVDIVMGQVWSASAVENLADIADLDDAPEPDGLRWLELGLVSARDRYNDLRDFIATVDDPGLAERLARAVEGKDAMRRFRSVIDRAPEENTRWHAFSDDRRLGRARAWLADAGYSPARSGAPAGPQIASR